jgi:putative endonuclease
MKETPSGKLGEELAVSFLLAKGYSIAERNWRSGREGEIDIIAYDREVLVFVEVKSRFSDKFGRPSLAVHQAKQRQIARIAKSYLYRRGLYGRVDCRFDVVTVRLEGSRKTMEHLTDAFRVNPR